MKGRMLQALGFLRPGYSMIAGSFRVNDVNPVTELVCEGVASVARTGVGAFTITMEDTHKAWICGDAGLRQHTPAVSAIAKIGDVDVVTAKTVLLQLFDAAAAADFGAADATYVDFWCICRETSVSR